MIKSEPQSNQAPTFRYNTNLAPTTTKITTQVAPISDTLEVSEGTFTAWTEHGFALDGQREVLNDDGQRSLRRKSWICGVGESAGELSVK